MMTFFLSIAPADVNGVARITLEFSCGSSMFFDEKMLPIALFFVESHVLCRLCPWLSSLSIVVFVHCRLIVSGHAATRAFQQNAVPSELTKTPCSCRWTSTYSHKTPLVAFLVSWKKSNNEAASLLLLCYFGCSWSSVYCQHSNQALLPYRMLVKFDACLGNSLNYDIILKMRVLCSSFSAP